MKKPPFLSVILPTYNRAYCISRMIDSVLMQSFRDFELIIIDDGSRDGTFDFVKHHYQDQRIRLFYQENAGVSHARNQALQEALGLYVVFVDSDDYLLQGFFEDIFEMAERYRFDTLIYGGYVLYPSGRWKNSCPFWTAPANDKINRMINPWRIDEFLEAFCLHGGNSWACAKIFKRTLIEDYRVLFDERIAYGEDMLFNLQNYLHSSCILTSPSRFYVYVINTQGLSHRGLRSLKKFQDLLLAYDAITQDSQSHQAFLALNYFRHSLRHLARCFWKLTAWDRDKIKRICKEAYPKATRGEKLLLLLITRSPVLAWIYFPYEWIWRVYAAIFIPCYIMLKMCPPLFVALRWVKRKILGQKERKQVGGGE